jgi:hypothetical protein
MIQRKKNTESVCACAKLFVDEESTWHKSNRGIEQNIDGFYTKTTQKGEFSKLGNCKQIALHIIDNT